MSSVNETAYPQLKAEFTLKELRDIYTPSPAEQGFVFSQYRQAPTRACLLVQLKIVQRLGYFMPLRQLPRPVIEHVCECAGLRPPTAAALTTYDRSGSKSLHQQRLRNYLNIRQMDAAAWRWLGDVAHKAAATKQELPDIINVLIEELVRQRYELPGFTRLSKLAAQARVTVNEQIYQQVMRRLTPDTIQRLEPLLQSGASGSRWDDLKREPKRPTVREVASFLKHIAWLQELAQGLPAVNDIAATKRAQLTLEARALDKAEMRALRPEKRYTLEVLLLRSQLQKAMDDVADIFIKTLAGMHRSAELRLQEYRLKQAEQVDRLVTQFRNLLSVIEDDETAVSLDTRITGALQGEPAAWLAQCEEYLAYAGNNTFPFLLKPYGTQRSLLFQCLEVLSLKSSSQDDSVLRALAWLQQYRSSHREFIGVDRNDLAQLELSWLPEKWQRLVFGKKPAEGDAQLLHRKYLELAVFSQVMQDLKSGDLYVEHSDQYDDYREHLVSWEEYEQEIVQFGELIGLPVDGQEFVIDMRRQLLALAEQVDQGFPRNGHIDINDTGVVIRRHERQEPPPQLEALDQEIIRRMPGINILDMLAETEQWLELHRLFGPLSGFEAKIDNPRKRFITTLFCYGCNLGPSQTARSVKSLSRKQVAWLNLRHITEERLDKAIVKVINAYSRFALPRYWGSGKHASADGTKWNLYEQNLLSEYHIRYGGYGGIGYYHVSDTYIALFSHFIPCGVYEAIYILDGLLKNQSDIQPDTVHGDSQAQSTPVFALAHLLGIKLMPRIRNIKDLVFFKPEKDTHYPHIGRLFKGSIDWELIARHYPDMLRVVISIKAGKITPSLILRRLGTASRKNKLYFAFRELGRAVRTQFLLNYINDIELRRTIQAATNKSEEFNGFAQWLFFGGEGIIAENVRHEQRKIIKYNHLVANMVILNNVQNMSRVLKMLQEEGHTIDEDLLKALAPYRKAHINRFGDYLLDLNRRIDPLDYKIKFH